MKNNHLYRVLCLMLSLMVLVLVGCSNSQVDASGTNPEENLPPVTLVEGFDIDFHQMMKQDLNTSLSYSGTVDYYRTEVVENIEKILNPTPYEIYSLEVNREDLSGGEVGDQSLLKKMKVADNVISYVYSDKIEEILLQKPLKVDESWQTVVYSQDQGFIDVLATIIDVDSEKGITVKYESHSGIDYHREFVFKKEGGLVTERFIMPDLILEHQLVQIAATPDSNYVSRYIHPSEKLMAFYHEDAMKQLVVDGQMKKTLREAENDTTRFTLYKTYLSQLTFDHMTDVKRMKEMTQYAMSLSDDDFQYIDKCIDTYEAVYSEWGYDWFETLFTGNSLDIEKYYQYDGDNQIWTFVLSSEIDNPEDAAIAQVLKSCGAGYESSEGDGFFVMTRDFLEVGFYSDEPSVSDYLSYKEGQYTSFPLMNDGYIIKSPMQMIKSLHFFESFAKQYEDHLGFEEAEYYANYIFDVVAIPNDYESNDSKYINGYISEDYLKAYEDYMHLYPESHYTPLFKELVDGLHESSGFFSEHLRDEIVAQGLEVNYSALDEHYVQLEERESLEKHPLFEVSPVSEQVVTVDNVEDLLDNIKPDVIIELVPGQYSLSSNRAYGSEYVDLSEGVLKIKNVSNFGIRVQNHGQADLNTDSYLEVIKLDNVSQFSIEDLRIGHIYDFCVGDVISISNSSEIQLDHLILYGCGYNGLSLSEVTHLTVGDTVISDCQASGLVVNRSNDINLVNTIMRRNGRQVFDISFSKNVKIENAVVEDNTKDMYRNERGLFKIISSDPIETRLSVFDTSQTGRLVEGDGEIVDLP